MIINNRILSATNNISALWTPSNLPGLGAWYKPKDIGTLTLTNSLADQLRDKSGNLRHFNAGGISRPVYNSISFNGFPCLEFDGSMALTSSVAFNSNVSASIIFMPLAGGKTYNGIYSNASGSTGKMILRRASGAGNSWGTFIGSSVLATIPLLDGLPYIVTMDGLSGGTFWTNEVNSGTYLGAQGQPAHIGGFGGQNLAGRIAEIVVSTNDLATDNRQKLAGYYAHEYNLTSLLPIDHPYKNSPPTV